MKMNNREVLIRVKGLSKRFPVKKSFFEEQQYVQAVDHVSFTLKKGETMGIVGESGCGKSTLARTILRLIEPTEGEIEYKGQSIIGKKEKELKLIRKDMQIIFQDPYNSLHPRMKIGDIIAEPLVISKMIPNKDERNERIKELIKMVGLDEPYLERYPHELSGGQRQRIVIARALATNPELVICDEPVSALDVSVRAQILNLLEELQEKLNLTYIFISHDLSVVEHICDTVYIMYLGQIIESGMTEDIFENPIHPYTEALLSAIPVVGRRTNEGRIILEGDIPSPVNPPSGCRFRTRCRYARSQCEEKPLMQEVEKNHFVACHKLNWQDS